MAFKYKSSNLEALKMRAQGVDPTRDAPINKSLKFYKPTLGDNSIRFLPASWDGATHFGLDVHVHYMVGADGNTYLCNQKMKNDKCPICEEEGRAKASGDREYAKKLYARRRVAVYVVDRAKPAEGPLIWMMPPTLDKDICIQMVDPTTSEVYSVDDPNAGFDVFFQYVKKGGAAAYAEYSGIRISRTKSKLHTDAHVMNQWLDFIEKNPIPAQLVYYSYDHIKEAFSGSIKEFEEPKPEKDEVEDIPFDLGKTEVPVEKVAETIEPETIYTWESVHELINTNPEELMALCDKHSIDLSSAEDLEGLALAICATLKLQPPKKEEPAKSKAQELKEKLAKFKK